MKKKTKPLIERLLMGAEIDSRDRNQPYAHYKYHVIEVLGTASKRFLKNFNKDGNYDYEFIERKVKEIFWRGK